MRKLSSYVAPVYLLACLVFGGSAQAVWGSFGLQVAAIGILVWLAATPMPDDARAARLPALVLVAALAYILVQLLPLPPAIWSGLGHRGHIAEAYSMMGWPLPWLPISLAPFDSATTLFAILPPLAMIAAVRNRAADRNAILALIAGAAASILVGAVQASQGPSSTWYLYEFTSAGAVGLFANANHFATLLLVTIPFAAALLLSRSGGDTGRGKAAASTAIALTTIALVLIGIMLNRSLAALLLSIPVMLASALMFAPAWRYRLIVGPIAGIAVIAAVLTLSLGSLRSALPVTSGAEKSVVSRQELWAVAAKAFPDALPLGTGLGTFPQAYQLHEDPHSVDSFYVNHAHNDYLELAFELGLPGILLMIMFLSWWGIRTLRIWSSRSATSFAKAATIASGAILAHSLVDFPLRTAAVAAVFGLCIGLMVRNEGEASRPGRSSTRARHVKIG
jgi:O-antigen ligase